MNSKAELRVYYKSIRDKLSPEQRGKFSRLIYKNLATLPEFTSAKRVFVYNSFGSEVDTSVLISEHMQGKELYLPKTEGGAMYAVRVYADTEYDTGNFGIKVPRGETLAGGALDICICPGLAFDKSGNRLGYGKGYYDKFLKGTSLVKIGICYGRQLADNIPADGYDIKMDILVTEENVIRI